MITEISYYDELNTKIVVAYEGGYQHLYEADFRNAEITEWLETRSITPWVDPIDYNSLMRAVRNTKLELCDYTQLPDAPFTPEEKVLWAAYRQALRDFPNQHNVTTRAEYDALVWPQEP